MNVDCAVSWRPHSISCANGFYTVAGLLLYFGCWLHTVQKKKQSILWHPIHSDQTLCLQVWTLQTSYAESDRILLARDQRTDSAVPCSFCTFHGLHYLHTFDFTVLGFAHEFSVTRNSSVLVIVTVLVFHFAAHVHCDWLLNLARKMSNHETNRERLFINLR